MPKAAETFKISDQKGSNAFRIDMSEEYGDRTTFNIGHLDLYHGPQELRSILFEDGETELCLETQQGDQDNTLGHLHQDSKLSYESRPFHDPAKKLRPLDNQSKIPYDSHQGLRPSLLEDHYTEGMQQILKQPVLQEQGMVQFVEGKRK